MARIVDQEIGNYRMLAARADRIYTTGGFLEATAQRARDMTFMYGYDSELPTGVADMVFAIDMLFNVWEPSAFLRELQRIARSDCVLVIDDGHQPCSVTLAKLQASGCWTIKEAMPVIPAEPVMRALPEVRLFVGDDFKPASGPIGCGFIISSMVYSSLQRASSGPNFAEHPGTTCRPASGCQY